MSDDRATLTDVLARQRRAWESGEGVRVEEMLQEYPHLAADADAVMDLLYGEIVLREERGAARPHAEYYARFPHLAEQLKLQFEVDDALTIDNSPPATTDGEPLPKLEGCDILEEIGRGAMGVVYRGWQRAALRQVAVKILGDDMPVGRVRNEIQAAARLQHPGIAQLFEVKDHAGRVALVLEYVEGGNLSEKLGGRPAKPLEAARLVENLAWAMAYAHTRGVIHRDLKPSNVLLTGIESMPLGKCAAKIGDFGLAKLVEGGVSLTQTADMLGTPSYMSPEQTGGPGAAVGPATDVYSLGAILYECLTGRPPFAGQGVLDTLEQVRHADPIPPSALVPGVPRDLEVIALKCLHKNPARRYASMRELADDLRAFQENRPITARPAGLAERLLRAMRRRPVVAALAAAAVVASVALLVGGVSLNALLRRQRDAARKQADDLDIQLARSRSSLYSSGLLRVGAVWPTDPLQGLRLLEDPETCPPELRCFSWNVLHNRCKVHHAESAALPGPAAALAVEGGLVAAADIDGRVVITGIDAPEKFLFTFRTSTGRPTALALAAGGKAVAVGTASGAVSVHSLDGTELARFTLPPFRGSPAEVLALAWHPDGSALAVSSASPIRFGTLALYDPRDGRLRRTLRGEIGPRPALAFSGDGNTLAAGGADNAVLLWDTRTGATLPRLVGHTAAVGGLAFSVGLPDGSPLGGNKLVSTGLDASIRIWDLTRGTSVESFESPLGPLAGVALGKDGRTIAACAATPAGEAEAVEDVQVWDMVTRRAEDTLRAHPGGALGLQVAAGGNLVTLGPDRVVRTWVLPRPRTSFALNRFPASPGATAMSADAAVLAWTTGDEVGLFDLASGEHLRPVPGHGRPIRHVALDADGSRLAAVTGRDDETSEVYIRQARTGRLVQVIPGAGGPGAAVAFLPGDRLLVGSADGSVRIWDIATAKILAESVRPGAGASMERLTTSADGSTAAALVAGGSKTREIVVFSLRDLSVRAVHPVGDVCRCLALSSAGESLAHGGRGGRVVLADVTGGDAPSNLNAGMQSIDCLAFSRDGKTLAVGGSAPAARLWDVPTRQERAALPGHPGGVCFVGFDAKGELLLSAGARGTARIWRAK